MTAIREGIGQGYLKVFLGHLMKQIRDEKTGLVGSTIIVNGEYLASDGRMSPSLMRPQTCTQTVIVAVAPLLLVTRTTSSTYRLVLLNHFVEGHVDGIRSVCHLYQQQ